MCLNAQVSRVGEELLRKRAYWEGTKPAVDLEDATLIGRALLLFHGASPPNCPPTAKVLYWVVYARLLATYAACHVC